jgi:hypothetical protein
VSNLRESRGIRVSFVDDDGSLYMTMGDGTIMKRNLDGTFTLIAGIPSARELGAPVVDGPVATARFPYPLSIAKGPDGALYVGDDNFIRVIRDGQVTTLAGHNVDELPELEADLDGVGIAATMSQVEDIWFHTDGRLLFWDEDMIRTVSLPGGAVTTIGRAGTPAADAINRLPNQACDREGNCYFSSVYAQETLDDPTFFIARKSTAGVITLHGEIGDENTPGTVGSERAMGTARFKFGVGTFACDASRKILYFTDEGMLRMIKLGADDPLQRIAVPPGTTDSISAYPIPYDTDTRMVDFHGERGFGRYYTRDTYDQLNIPRINPYTGHPMLPHVPLNPMTRQVISPGDVTEYIAYIDPNVKKQAATKIQSVVRGRQSRRKTGSNAAAGGRRKTRRRRTRRTRR